MNLLFTPGADILVLGFAALVGLYMAANIGANDLANAMGTSVGSGGALVGVASSPLQPAMANPTSSTSESKTNQDRLSIENLLVNV